METNEWILSVSQELEGSGILIQSSTPMQVSVSCKCVRNGTAGEWGITQIFDVVSYLTVVYHVDTEVISGCGAKNPAECAVPHGTSTN